MALTQSLTRNFYLLTTATALGLSGIALGLPAQAASIIANTSNTVGSGFDITDRDALDAAGIAFVEVGGTRIYTGTRQVSPNNQDPFVVSFTGDRLNWQQVHDQSPIDADGAALLWDGGSDSLYAAFGVDGGSGGPNTFGPLTQGGWLGFGRAPRGGLKATVLLRLDATTGEALNGTYISAIGEDGTTRSAGNISNFLFGDGGSIILDLDAFFSPRGIDGQVIDPERNFVGTSPFEYRIELSADLSTALDAIAVGWNGVTELPPLDSGDDSGDSTDDGDGTDDGTGGGGDGSGDNGDDTDGGDGSTGGGEDDGTGGSDDGDGGSDDGDGSTDGDDDGDDDDDADGGGDDGGSDSDEGDSGTGDDGSADDDDDADGSDGDSDSDGGDDGDDSDSGDLDNGDPKKVPEPSVLGAIAALGGLGALRKWRNRR